MRKQIVSGIVSGFLLTTSYVPKSQAFVCLGPDPLCVTVIVGLVGGFFKAISQMNNGEVQAFHAGLRSEEAVKGILKDLRVKSKHYTLRMGGYYRESGGYQDLVQRVAKGKLKGNLSIESLVSSRPQLFTDLDILESVLRNYVDEETLLKTYGEKYHENGEINWSRYAILAQEAAILYENLFVVE